MKIASTIRSPQNSMDIYIWEKGGERNIRIPILPEEIDCKMGETIFATYSIMNRGDVAVPTGTELASYRWKSEFPGKPRKKDPLLHGPWIEPKTYHNVLEAWKDHGTPLILCVIGYPINVDVYIKDYQASAAGAFGDIYYQLEFQELREVEVIKTTPSSETTTAKERTAQQPQTYTIVTGDTLWGIAQKFYGDGNKWSDIYNTNKEIIESTAKERGKKSSENGWWIFPGVKLTIPK